MLNDSEIAINCAICGSAIDAVLQLWVPTTNGGYVHVVCADRLAIAAQHRRTIYATISAAITILILLLISIVWASILLVALLGIGFTAVHILMNRHWWRIIGTRMRWSLRRWL